MKKTHVGHFGHHEQTTKYTYTYEMKKTNPALEI